VTRGPIETYLGHLDAGEAADAVACFADDALYLRPRMDPEGSMTSEFEVMRGTERIAEFFAARGKPRGVHELVWSQIHDGVQVVVGHSADGPPGRTDLLFFSVAQLDDDDLIAEYASSAIPMESDLYSSLAIGRGPSRDAQS